MDRKLNDYLPNIVKDIQEIDLILQTEQPEIVCLYNAVDETLSNQFISSSTENGISRWEKILKITPKGTETLEYRKFRVMMRMNEKIPYTIKTLKQSLDLLCGIKNYYLYIDNFKYLLKFKLDVSQRLKYLETISFIRNVIPANIEINALMLMNTNSSFIRIGSYTTIANYIKILPYLPHPVKKECKVNSSIYTKTGEKLLIKGKE